MASYLDPTLTTNVFDFLKWVNTAGAAVAIVKTIKENDNTDADSNDIQEGGDPIDQ